MLRRDKKSVKIQRERTAGPWSVKELTRDIEPLGTRVSDTSLQAGARRGCCQGLRIPIPRPARKLVPVRMFNPDC